MAIFSNSMLARGPGNQTYDQIFSAITGKIVVLRGDQSSAPNGNSLSTTPWDNEASATDAIGNPTWQTSALNGFRGVNSSSNNSINTQLALSTLLPSSSKSFTGFAVEKRTGTQGNNSGVGRYLNSTVFSDSSGYWGVVFDGTSREFFMYSYDTDYRYQASGYSFTDGAPYALAVRVNSSGATRINFNGSATNFPSAGQVSPSVKTGIMRCLFQNSAGGATSGYEYLLTTSEMTDQNMDNFVLALKAKWGIS